MAVRHAEWVSVNPGEAILVNDDGTLAGRGPGKVFPVTVAIKYDDLTLALLKNLIPFEWVIEAPEPDQYTVDDPEAGLIEALEYIGSFKEED